MPVNALERSKDRMCGAVCMWLGGGLLLMHCSILTFCRVHQLGRRTPAVPWRAGAAWPASAQRTPHARRARTACACMHRVAQLRRSSPSKQHAGWHAMPDAVCSSGVEGTYVCVCVLVSMCCSCVAVRPLCANACPTVRRAQAAVLLRLRATPALCARASTAAVALAVLCTRDGVLLMMGR